MSLSIRRLRSRFGWCAISLWFVSCVTTALAAPDGLGESERHEIGRQIYEQQCVKCHGARGEGVADVYDEVLSGDHSLDELARIIDETMPEESPEDCAGEEARYVAAYIFDAFYSPTARMRNVPPRVALSHLTVPQYRNSLADLLGTSAACLPPATSGGLLARYYNDRGFPQDKLVIERTDPQVDFSYGEESPDAKTIKSDAFAVRWEGSIIAEETGDYEFLVTTQNGFRLWINDTQNPAIDAWVSSGAEPSEHKTTRFLLGGRAYPIKLHFFKYKDAAASVRLEWHPPYQVRQVVPARNLMTEQVPETLVITAPFPPDDSSQGYARGTSISQAWDEATTHAATEAANYLEARLDALAHVGGDADQREAHVRDFCRQLAERAFRRPLSDEQQQFFVDRILAEDVDLNTSFKRIILLVLKSPRFLYPGAASTEVDDYEIANRMALTLWDSLPDKALSQAAAQGQLHTAEQITDQARRMLADPRANTKLRSFFHAWLEVDEADNITRDAKEFPGFDAALLADLRVSLDRFLDDIVWSESSDFRQLLLADHLFLNGHLATFYGIKLPDPASTDTFQRVSLTDGQRAGLVTHPYLLTTFAYYRSTSPIHRGVFVTRKLLGRALKPPPMAIEFMDDRFEADLTMREKVSQLTEPAACQTCHRVINPLGFSLEHFDAVGRFRTMEKQKPINVMATYTTEDGDPIELHGARDLAEMAIGQPTAHRAFVQQLFQLMVKQPVNAYGSTTLENLYIEFARSRFNIQALLVEITKTVALHSTDDSGGRDRHDDAQDNDA